MTEKRFYISSDNNQNVYDTVLKCYYSSVDAQKLCDLLNELHEEKELALKGIIITDELIRKYGSDELKHEYEKEITVKYRWF